LSKYMHPPAEKLDSYCGMPDENNTPSIVTEYRFNRDLNLESYNTATRECNGMLFLQLNIPGVPVVGWPLSDGSLLKSAAYVVLLAHESYNPVDWFTNSDTGRFNYQSVTYSLDATGFNNQGIVTTAQFRPSCFEEAYETSANPNEKTVATFNIDDLPVNGRLISMISPKTYSGLAKEGNFSVQRMSQPTNAYKSVMQAATNDANFYLPPRLTFRISGVLFDLRDYATEAKLDFRTNWFSDFTCSWVLFEGMSVTSGIAPPARINVKAISCYEAGINGVSAYSPFVRQSAPYDFTALQAATRATHAMQDGMPAAMNSLGSFLIPALKYAPGVITALMPMLQSASSGILGYFNTRQKNKQRNRVKDEKIVAKALVARAANRSKPASPKKRNKTKSQLEQVAAKLENLDINRKSKRNTVRVNLSKKPLRTL